MEGAGLTLRWIERARGSAKRLAVKGSATAMAAVRESSARLFTGNVIPLLWVDGRKKRFNAIWHGEVKMTVRPGCRHRRAAAEWEPPLQQP